MALLAACATTEKAKSWVGATYDDAVRAWGAPARSGTLADGTEVHTWVSEGAPTYRSGPSVGFGVGGFGAAVVAAAAASGSAPTFRSGRARWRRRPRCERTLSFRDGRLVGQAGSADEICAAVRASAEAPGHSLRRSLRAPSLPVPRWTATSPQRASPGAERPMTRWSRRGARPRNARRLVHLAFRGPRAAGAALGKRRRWRDIRRRAGQCCSPASARSSSRMRGLCAQGTGRTSRSSASASGPRRNAAYAEAEPERAELDRLAGPALRSSSAARGAPLPACGR